MKAEIQVSGKKVILKHDLSIENQFALEIVFWKEAFTL